MCTTYGAERGLTVTNRQSDCAAYRLRSDQFGGGNIGIALIIITHEYSCKRLFKYVVYGLAGNITVTRIMYGSVGCTACEVCTMA